MKKEKLEKVLVRYSGAATLVLGAQAAQGQTVWNNIPDTTLSNNNQFFELDINGDNEVDYRITQFVDSLIGSENMSGVQVETFGTAGNQVLGLDYMNYNYPFRLNVGDTIGEGRPFKGVGKTSTPNRFIGYMGLLVDSTTYPNSQFVDRTNGITDGFLGLRFRADVNDTIRTFYGWVRLDVAADLRSVTIKDFAYQSTPDSAIRAGEGSPLIGIEEVEVELPAMVQRGEYLDVELPESFSPSAEVSFFSLSGQLIRKEEIEGHSNRIPLQSFPKGILVAVVRSNGMDTSKKIVVY